MKDVVVLPGPSSADLGKCIANRLKCITVPVDLRIFSDGESKIRIDSNLLNKKCIVIQSTYPPVDSHLMQILMIIYGCYESGASEVIPIIPYMGYARQDRKFLEGEFATISLIAKLLECNNIHNLITIDIHSVRALSYFNLNVFNISSIKSLSKYATSKLNLVNPIVVSPDIGGSLRAKEFSQDIQAKFFALRKTRDRITGNVVMDSDLQENIKDHDIIIIDDMISSGETILKAIEILKKNRCRKIYAMCAHVLSSENTINKLKEAGLTDLISTNSIPRSCSKVDLSIEIANTLHSILP
ncbi:MAG TPA: ribose-phosphate diphosphokinase [Candidatus Nitrosocosmicus sp.]|nr:ribose-phosphate diphosphokinase [Candidatus Nitrosocosmicus sp.]